MMQNNMYYDYYCSESPYDYTGFDPNQTSLSSSSYVDCTLSLGTPSTRSETKKQSSKQKWWNLASNHSADQSHNFEGSEPVAAAMTCGHCGTDSTPLWRKGPNGPKSLCNACGIRYKKEERRRAAA